MEKNLDISLNIQDVFSKYREMSSTTAGVGFSQKSTYLNPMRNFGLSITYRFGDLKSSMKKVQRTITNEDVLQGQDGASQGSTVPVQ